MSNKTLPKPPRIVSENNAAAAILSKMNSDQSNANNNVFDIANWNIPEVSVSISEKIKNNDNIVELFPDTELSIQILVSSIISPNDLLTTKINFNSPDIKLPTEIKQTITSTIKTYVESEYKIESKLPKIVKEALFTKGAYIEVIIPEASIDEMINNYQTDGQVSVESLTDRIDRLGKSKYDFLGVQNVSLTLSLEDNMTSADRLKYKDNNKTVTNITEDDLGIVITDNPTILNKTNIAMKITTDNVKARIYKKAPKVSTEEEDVDLDSIFKNNNMLTRKEVIYVNNKYDAKRTSVGKPLVMNLPTESVIPVHVVNDPTKHLGYFILLDNNGIPVDLNNNEYNSLNQNMVLSNHIGQDSKLNMINKAKQALYGITKEDIKLNNIEVMYGRLVEEAIKQKLKNGMWGELAEIKDNADIYRVMLMRALKAQQTRLLFIPKELVAYYAFDFRENGTGKSLLEQAAILYSIRAILLFTNLMATIKNNTTITEVNATLDDADADPEKTMEKIMSETLKSRQTMLPLGVTKLEDLAEWTHKLGFKYNFKHPGLPDMTITTTNTSAGDKVVPDEALNNEIKEHIIMSFGLTPEMVQAGYNIDFATTLVAKNLLLAKRVTQLQNILNPLLQDHISKLLTNDMVIVNKVKEIVSNNIELIKKTIKKEPDSEGVNFDKIKKDDLIDYITDKYINEMDIYLPTPELNEANAMKDAFIHYKDTVNEFIDLIISAETFPTELVGEVSGNFDQVKNIMKTILIKKWMNDNNYIPEVGEFLTQDDEGKPLFNFLEEYEHYVDGLTTVLLPFLKRMSTKKGKTDEKLSKLGDMGVDADSGGDDSGYDDGDDAGGDDLGGDNLEEDTGGEDLGQDENIEGGGEEEPTPDEATPEEEPAPEEETPDSDGGIIDDK